MTKQCVPPVVLVLLAVSLLLAAPATPTTAPATAPAKEAAKVDSWDVSRLGRTRLGEVWSGPNVRLADLRGQVVLLEFWGYNCPPCVRSMPHLGRLHSRHGRDGLVVIGAHVGASAKEQALAVVKRVKAAYTILSGAFVPGVRLTHIPRAFVFDGHGRLVHEGAPDQGMDRAIARALACRPHPLLNGRKYPAMALAVAKIKAGRLGEAWQDCKANAGDKGQTGREARELLAALDGHARKRLDEARRTRQADPARAAAMLKKLAADFRGAPFADRAENLRKGPAGKRGQ